MSAALTYKGYIQGLRGVAVLSVLLYHINSYALPGGFVGVDVFFVISGFLLTRILIKDVEVGSFSIVGFYARCARRILPAFITVGAAILFCSIFLLLPPESVNVARSLVASALFVPNVYFYATSEYFGPAAGVLPALHFWSLGVEEQYYVLLPIVLSIGLRFSRTVVTRGSKGS